ncbi:MAG: AAA family ATPase [Deltaproteobacteria bacterium]|nr:AAA family ATPase [Deltaproteobacteria bacterium]NND28401.1 AAA domain-containing protein [Myxococcales bacterium]MBT8465987.1 AAA family ATPase [Deltaproteobacteria bacterium]MBT8483274.1 AAA family ATPase [Deltaproteobacteria bacterium]NNK05731.1 AAA domain-containing protein [Myxococcales bacterium]
MKKLTLRLDSYSEDARRYVAAAQRLADERGHAEVQPIHLWYELVDTAPAVQAALDSAGVDATDVLVDSEWALRRVAKTERNGLAYLSTRFLELLSRAELEATQHAGLPVGTANLALACAQEPEGLLRSVLRTSGMSSAILRQALADAGENDRPDGRAEAEMGVLDEYGRDLTRLAAQDAFDPLIGREAELRRMLQVLARRKENNPLLVGEDGTGRTALVHGLASRIAADEVPELLADKRIIALDSAELVAGTKLRGQLEERMRSILDAVRDSGGQVILFLPNLAGFLRAKGGAGDMLASALSRGEVRALARCTPDELREINDEASTLSRRLVPITVEPPSSEQAVAILQGLKARLEAAHEVEISEPALDAAVRFARRYVAGRELPKSAIDLIDESAARVRLGLDGDESDSSVGPEDVAAVVSLWTGVPASKMMEEEAQKLLHMEDRLRERVVGQDHAVSALSKAVRRGRVGLRDPKRPIGSFLFLGPTGVGKTELAKTLAAFLFDDEAALTRLDMSEFMEKHMVARLIGAPPGYVDSEAGGFLTEAVRRRPYSVVLFDEVEKAHPDVFNILLQVLEDGRLSDSRGRVAHFRDTVIIMTSNVGSELILEHQGSDEALNERIEERLHDYFRPEFLNRVDEVLIFDRLDKEELAAILEIQLRQLHKLLAPREIGLTLTDASKERLIDLGYDPAFGARPLKRVLVRELQDPLAEALLRGEFSDGDTIAVDSDGTSFSFQKA